MTGIGQSQSQNFAITACWLQVCDTFFSTQLFFTLQHFKHHKILL